MSRPASGSEHHFSHYFEITGIVKYTTYEKETKSNKKAITPAMITPRVIGCNVTNEDIFIKSIYQKGIALSVLIAGSASIVLVLSFLGVVS